MKECDPKTATHNSKIIKPGLKNRLLRGAHSLNHRQDVGPNWASPRVCTTPSESKFQTRFVSYRMADR